MKNPYEILELPQNATVPQIMSAMPKAIRKKLYPSTEIAQASAQLRKPATRLAADFTFPIFEQFDDMKPLKPLLTPEIIDINSLDANTYNSL